MDGTRNQTAVDEVEEINPKSIEELRDLRQEFVTASKKNGTFEGIKKLLTQLYPDNAHFLYELIQNADDAGAENVTIQLTREHLKFWHDGKKLFDLNDIKSITNIGKSTKLDDGTTIGKFGIGFKSVYAYTENPTINSGDFHVIIIDLMVPEVLSETDNEYTTATGTLFSLPFNCPEKNPSSAYSDIRKILSSFSAETLLFLRNVKAITYEFEDSIYEISKKEDNHLVIVSEENPAGKGKLCFLKFSNDQAEVDTTKGVKKLHIDIAYKLGHRQQTLINDEKGLSPYKIIPADSRRSVFISFLAEKETSGLRFYINGFFATPPSRDSISDTPENNSLLQRIVELQLESLTYIRDNGFLDMDFLEVLPNSKDNLSSFYEPFHASVVKAFQEQSFMLAKNGGFFPARELISTSAAISAILTDENISKILLCTSNKKVKGWSRNPQQLNSNTDRFISDLGIGRWGNVDLIKFLVDYTHLDQKNLCLRILREKDSEKLSSLYSLLDDGYDECSYFGSRFQEAKIFKLTNDRLASADEKIYVLDESYSADITKYKFIAKDLYPPNKKDKVLSFFRKVGIVPYSLESICDEIYEKYSEGSRGINVGIGEHLHDITVLVENKRFSSGEIAGKKILYSKDGRYCSPSDIYLDEPYQKSSPISGFSSALEIAALSNLYISLKPKVRSEFLNVLRAKDSGLVSGLQIVRTPVKDNPRYIWELSSGGRSSTYVKDEDYMIRGLKGILKRDVFKKAASRLIWELLIKQSETLEAKYSPNRRHACKTCPSYYIQLLAQEAWLLQKDGSLKSPQDSEFESLPPSWPRPDCPNPYEHPALKAIHFGEMSAINREKEKEKKSACKTLGVNQEEIDFINKFRSQGYSVKEMYEIVAEFSAKNRNAPMPTDESANSQSRAKRTEEGYGDSPERTHERKERAVRITGSKVKESARGNLKEIYTDGNDALRCQLCRAPMPFKKRNGEFYFEATQIEDEMKKEHPAQYLALCPNCSAEYSEWVKKEPATCKSFISEIINKKEKSVDGSVVIPITFKNGKQVSVYFTEKHFIDIQVCLEKEHEDEI